LGVGQFHGILHSVGDDDCRRHHRNRAAFLPHKPPFCCTSCRWRRYRPPFRRQSSNSIFGAQFGDRGRALIAAVAVVLIGANLSAAIWGVSRLVFSLARERVQPTYRSRRTADLCCRCAGYSAVCGCRSGLCWPPRRREAFESLRAKLLYPLRFCCHGSRPTGPPFLGAKFGIACARGSVWLSILRGGALICPVALAIVALIVHWRRRTLPNAYPTLSFTASIPNQLGIKVCTRSPFGVGKTRPSSVLPLMERARVIRSSALTPAEKSSVRDRHRAGATRQGAARQPL
jgi:hypothetical protein